MGFFDFLSNESRDQRYEAWDERTTEVAKIEAQGRADVDRIEAQGRADESAQMMQSIGNDISESGRYWRGRLSTDTGDSGDGAADSGDGDNATCSWWCG